MRFFVPKNEDDGEAHVYFAWFPVWAYWNNALVCVWLEKVMRIRRGNGSFVKYRYHTINKI